MTARQSRLRRLTARAAVGCAGVLLLVSGCGGGGVGEAREAEERAQEGGGLVPSDAVDTTRGSNCTGFCADTPTRLERADVERIIAQAAAEAEARNAPATIAVVDRVGNVLAVYRMADAPLQVTITSTDVVGAPVMGGLEGVNIIPAELAAIAKAITGAYLSTEGNAFTTRTASQIVQENFNPGEMNQPSGPLFGVQFSQLPCGDFVTRFTAGEAPGPGPHRSPLGLAADAGGLPLYKRGTAVGGIGTVSDGVYSLDKLSPTTDGPEGFEFSPDELVALAGTVGFAPNPSRKADVITVVGKTLRYTDVAVSQLLTTADAATPFASLAGGSLRAVLGYYDGLEVLAGTPFGHPSSGIRPAGPGAFVDADGVDLDAFVFVDRGDNDRFPPRGGTDAPGGDPLNALTAEEVRRLMTEGLKVANRARAQIRRPLGTPARVTVAIVDGKGEILGMARTRDGPVFGADVALQKARTAAFFSGTGTASGPAPADALSVLPRPRYLAALEDPGRFAVDPGFELVEALLDAIGTMPTPSIADYLQDLRTFLGEPDFLAGSGMPRAMSNRSVGNLARPFYPDGVADGPPGPLSKPRGAFSIFSTGLQLDLSYNAIIHHVAHIALPDIVTEDVGLNCTGNTGFDPDALFQTPVAARAIANGIQIFPGSVPIYRGDLLVGAFGVSGDGIDQDDMVAFLGTHNAGMALQTGLGNAPRALRSDRLRPIGARNTERLRYVGCPQAPFNDSDVSGVCERADAETN